MNFQNAIYIKLISVDNHFIYHHIYDLEILEFSLEIILIGNLEKGIKA